MADLVQQPGAVHTQSSYARWTGYYYGSGGEAYDGNLSTYYGVSSDANGAGTESNNCYCYSTHTWAVGVPVSQVTAKIYGQSYSWGNYANRGVNPQILHRVRLLVSGVWTTIYTYTDPYYAGDGQPNETRTSDVNVSGWWNNVTGVEIYSYAASYSYEGARHSRVWAYIYDVVAQEGIVNATITPNTLALTGTLNNTPFFNTYVQDDHLSLGASFLQPILTEPYDLTGVEWIAFDLWSNRLGSNLRFELHDTDGPIMTYIPEVMTINQWTLFLWYIGDVPDMYKDEIDTFKIVVINDDELNEFYVDNFRIMPPVTAFKVPDPATNNLQLNFQLPMTANNATFTLDIELLQPVPVITRMHGAFGPFRMEITAGYMPGRADMSPTIVRYIKDPIVTGGCPQCGTFLYLKKSRQITGTVVKHGRNFDIDKGLREDGYVRCGRCGFVVHKDRHQHLEEGSRAGWGMKYDETEAGS